MSIRTEVLMGTFVTIHVLTTKPAVSRRALPPESSGQVARRSRRRDPDEAIGRAFEWFRRVEECCTRFNPQSELMQLTQRVGVAVPVSPILYEAVRFALAVARESGGAFDPTVGHEMELRGFNREHRSGAIVRTPVAARAVTYRDVRVDPDRKTITLLRPLILDLGAVAKGLALDLAGGELHRWADYAIDAGGDLYLRGCNQAGEPWSVGIRHPCDDQRLLASLRVSNRAVCTSGDYERRGVRGQGHIVDPRSPVPADTVASVTVVAPTAMLADALATAAFVLGPAAGLRLFERHRVDGLIVSQSRHPGASGSSGAELERHATRGMFSDYHLGSEVVAGRPYSAVLPDAEGTAPADPCHSGSARRPR